MNTEQSPGVGNGGREGLRATRPVSGPPHHNESTAPGSPGDEMASAKVTRAWEKAYRRYGQAWEETARSGKGDPVVAREMVSASKAVAAAWRHISAVITLPWWTLAALESAAAAFEAQARDYESRDNSEER